MSKGGDGAASRLDVPWGRLARGPWVALLLMGLGLSPAAATEASREPPFEKRGLICEECLDAPVPERVGVGVHNRRRVWPAFR